MAVTRVFQRPLMGIVVALTVALAAGALVIGPTASPAVSAAVPRIELKVLVLSDGGPATAAIADQLATEGVPVEVVDLTSTTRKTITGTMLAGSVTVNRVVTPVAHYQAVVLPNASPAELSDAEKSALAAFQAQFDIRGVFAYTYAAPNVGLEAAVPEGFAGTLDGLTADLTPAARSAGFGYLDGAVPFGDVDPAVWESYGYVSRPLATQTAGAVYTPFVTVDAGPVSSGSVVGVYDLNGVENLVMTFVYRSDQIQFRLLAHGIVTWMTRGVHIGYERSYLSVHVDDVFLPDARWSVTGNCTPGEDCTNGEATTDIRMTAGDVAAVTAWRDGLAQRLPTAREFTLDLAFNGAGVAEAQAANGGVDEMSTALLSPATRGKYRWINHTWSHAYLGCVQDFSVVPWQCQRDASGNILWTSASTIQSEITRNRTFARNTGLTSLPVSLYRPADLVTGEHSGLQRLPNEPTDNPNLASALTSTGTTTIASDASRESAPRVVGSAVTVPRYPMAVYFNTATQAEMVSEYNWIYGSAANGGSGYCEANPETTTCLAAPLDPETGFTSYIVPWETRQSLRRMTSNDPRPVFVHQSNLAEERLLLTALDSVLGAYDELFSDSRPIVNAPYQAIRNELTRQQNWRTQVASVSGYISGTTVTIKNGLGTTVALPFTAPEGTTAGGVIYGNAYGGERSALANLGAGKSRTFTLPSGAGWPTSPAAPAPLVADVPALVEPEIVAEQPLLTPDQITE